MTLDDLPEKIKNELLEKRLILCKEWFINNAYDVCFTNLEGTRYFTAYRKQSSWNDDKGHSMPFGGGSQWHIRYGAILWRTTQNPLGGKEYEWCKSSKKTFAKAANGTIIPNTVASKKEVLDIAKKIGIFIMEPPIIKERTVISEDKNTAIYEKGAIHIDNSKTYTAKSESTEETIQTINSFFKR